MSIASVISSMQTNVSNAYDAISAKGGTIPANKNLQNLSTAIDSISSGASSNPFYFTSTSAFSVSMDLAYAQAGGTMQYSTNGSTWSNYSSGTTINGSAGGKVYFRGKNYSYISSNTTTNSVFTLTGTSKIYVHGNILYLLDYEKVENGNGISISMLSYCFSYLFSYQSLLDIAEDFELPSGTLTSYCYQYMFRGCTSLTIAPALPATALSSYCYQSMFLNCTSLTIAPALPATTISTYCYFNMFHGCTSLTIAPALPATTISNYVYTYMFEGCTNLTIPAKVGDGTTSYTYKSNAMRGMYLNCSSLRIFTSNQGSSTAFFKGLSATTSNSMNNMFQGCYIDGVLQDTGNGVAGQQYYY